LLNIVGNGRVGIGSTAPAELLEVNGAIKLGSTSNTNTGTIRWSGSDFEGYNGTVWQSLTADSSSGWRDDGGVVRLSTLTDKVGIGISSPAFALDVKDSLGINGARLLYLPDQTDFNGTLYIGDGGGSLSHTSYTDGKYNTAFGIGSLNANTNGTSNTASGYRALYSNTTGSCNTASGYISLYSNTIGYSNTASGYGALYTNTEGYKNTAIGDSSLYWNTIGDYNTASGYQALYSNAQGHHNTGNGSQALYSNFSGDYNTAIGYRALFSSSSSLDANTAIGYEALYSNKSYNNTASGYQALYSNTFGSSNTACGM
ncbi:hypothetical protein ACFL4L_03795, partial [bacterium]